jgi:hypothetical protein
VRPKVIEPATFLLVAQCLNQLRHLTFSFNFVGGFCVNDRVYVVRAKLSPWGRGLLLKRNKCIVDSERERISYGRLVESWRSKRSLSHRKLFIVVS